MVVRDGPYHQRWCRQCEGAVISVAATPNCSLICAATTARRLYLLDGAGNAAWDTPAVLQGEGWATAITRDGTVIAVGTAHQKPAGGRVYVFDQEKREIWSYATAAPIWSVSLSANGSVLAVASWDNHAYQFVRAHGTYELTGRLHFPEAHGLYGIALSASGDRCAIAAYDAGIVIVDENWSEIYRYQLESGIYNVSFVDGTRQVVVGLRDGNAVLATVDPPYSLAATQRVAARPVCGTNSSEDGQVLALGSFDGRLHVSDRSGRVLWSYTTEGEVWSTKISSDGGLVCIGSGDHHVRCFDNECTSAVLQEIHAAEASFDAGESEATLRRLVKLYLTHGMVSYGKDFLKSKMLRARDPSMLRQHVLHLLKSDLDAYGHHYSVHYALAETLVEVQQHSDAAHHFQEAARDPELRSRALTSAGDSFNVLGLRSASSSCYRRAREQHLNADSRRILYNLARSYERRERAACARRRHDRRRGALCSVILVLPWSWWIRDAPCRSYPFAIER